MSGSQFAAFTLQLPLAERENWIYSQVLSGNVPGFLRTLIPVTVTATVGGSPHTLQYYVTPDYLAIGSDEDYFLQPVTPILAQRLCTRLGLTLPTRRMVNQIWTNAAVKLAPQPIPPSPEMITVPVFADHNAMVRTQRNSYTNAFPLGALVSGDKKDLVVSTLIYSNLHTGVPRPVVIYGWHYQTGSPIQPLYNGHEETYADYSHGARLVQNPVILDGAPANITDLLTNASLAPLLSDEAASEATSNGVVPTPRYSVSPLGATILSSPRNQVTAPGSAPWFDLVAIGDLPMRYQWTCQGTNLPGASDAALVLTNAQSAAGGLYAAIASNAAGTVTSRPAWLRVIEPAALFFNRDFEQNRSADWTVCWDAANGVPDFTIDWSFDYAAIPFTFNGVTGLIPPAPHSGCNATRALKLVVNGSDSLAATAAVNVYPSQLLVGEDFSLKFDLWLNYPGGAGGINSTGSTQHAIFGLNHRGTQPNWASTGLPASDGIWYAADGEGGTSADFRSYLGTGNGPPVDLTAAGQSGLKASNNSAAIYQTLFPGTRFETPGAPGKNWVEVELRQLGGSLSWFFDGRLVAQRANTSTYTNGTVMLGLMDVFPSIANPVRDSFVLFANLRVEDFRPEPRVLSVGRTPAGALVLHCTAIPGTTYVVEMSQDLHSWVEHANVLTEEAPLVYVDTSPPNTARFYRLRASK